jgi:hypothetical protein
MTANEIKADNGGLRYDANKPMMHLLPPDALLALAEVYTKACTPTTMYPQGKYPKRNWERGMDWSKVTDSLERHLMAFKMGEDKDRESGLLHAAHMAWNAMALLTYQLRKIGVDDRLVTVPPWIVGANPALAAKFGGEVKHVEGDVYGHITKELQANSQMSTFEVSQRIKEQNEIAAKSLPIEITPPFIFSDLSHDEAYVPPYQLKVGLRFRVAHYHPSLWEVIEILRGQEGNECFRAIEVETGEEHMMTRRAIGYLEPQPTNNMRCVHCPNDAELGSTRCSECKDAE